MKKLYTRFLILLLLVISGAVSLRAQDVTTQGKEFYLTFMRNNASWTQSAGDTVRLFITATKNTSGTITNPRTTYSQSFNVTANSVTIVTLPNLECVFQDTTIRNRILKVVTNDTISLFSLNQKANTTDASIILPTPALGSEYIVQSFNPASPSMFVSQGLVFATENNTTIRITPKVNLRNGRQAGVPFTITLNAAQGYYFESTSDLSGTKVQSIDSCKRIGVYGGDECVNVPNTCGACDHIYEQHFPVETWGKTFLFTTSRARSYDYMRITARDSFTTVTIGSTSSTLHAGNSIVQACSANTKIVADKRIAVMGYEVGTNCSVSGDPAMFWVSPVEQTMTSVVFCATPFKGIDSNFVNIVVKTVDTIRTYFNNVRLKGDSFVVIAQDPNYSVAKLRASPGSNKIVCDSGFSAFCYGLGLANSYAYSTGSSARGVRIGVTVNGGSTANKDTAYVCGTTSVQFELSLNKPVNNVLWTLDTGSTDTSTLLNPFHSYPDTGLYRVRVLAYRGGDCSLLVDTIYVFVKVQPPGQVNAGKDTITCINGPVTLSASAIFGKPPGYSFQWNFSPNTGPSQAFTTSKDSTVRVILNDGCGFRDTDYVFVEVGDSLKLSINRRSDTTLCKGDSLSVSASGTGGNNNYTYSWTQGLGTGASKKIFADTTRTYKVVLADNCNSPHDSAVFTIFVRPPLDVSVRDTSICQGGSILISPSLSGGDSSYTLTWNNGLGTGTSKTLNPTSSTNYRVILSDACTVKNDTAFFTVSLRNPLSLSIAGDTNYKFRNDTIWDCPNVGSVTLNTVKSGGDSTRYSVRWDNSLGTGFSKLVNPSVTTKYRAILTDSCSTPEDTAYITVLKFNPLVLADVNDTILCYGDTASYSFQLSGGAGIYFKRLVISDSLGSAIYGTYYGNESQPISVNLFPLLSNYYKAIAFDSCTNSDTVYFRIQVRPALDVQLRSDTTICKGNSVLLQPSLSGGQSSSYTISWNNGLGTGSSKTVSPDTSTTYKVVLSDGCSNRNDTDDIRIFVRPALDIQLRTDTTICRGNSVNINSIASGGDSSYTINWNNGLGTGNSKTVQPDSSTSYIVILSDACTVKNDTASMRIYVRPLLYVKLPADTTICKGNTVNISPLSYGGGDSSYTLSWDNGLGTGASKTVTPDSSTTYRLILSDGCSPRNDTDYIRVFVRPPLDIQLPADTTICKGNSVQLAPGITGGDSSYTISWNNGLGTGSSKTVNPDTSTTYRVILSDGCTIKGDTDDIRIFVRPPLDIQLPADTTICRGVTVNINSMASGGDSSYTITWNNGLGTGSSKAVQPDSSTSYRVILSDGCTVKNDTDFMTVFVRPLLYVKLPADTTICKGNTVNISPLSYGGGDSSYTLSWDNGLGTGASKTVTPDSSTTYRLILSDGCSPRNDTDYIRVFVRPPLDIQLPADTTICKGRSVQISPLVSGGDSSYILSWNNSLGTGNSKSVNPDTSTTYRVILSDACTVKGDTDEMRIFVRPALTSIKSNDTLICYGSSLTIAIQAFGGDSSYTVTWNNGLGTGFSKNVTLTDTTTFRAILSDACTVKNDTSYITVYTLPPLELSFSPDSAICIGKSFTIEALGTGGRASTRFITWNDGSDTGNTRTVSPDTTTTYTVVLHDGCTVPSDTEQMTLQVFPPLKLRISNDTALCLGEPTVLRASRSGGRPNAGIITWDHGLSGEDSIYVNPPVTTTYRAILADNCSVKNDTQYVTLYVKEPLDVSIATPDTTICRGTSVTLTAKGFGGQASTYQFEWLPSHQVSKTLTVNPSVNSTYKVVLRDLCTAREDTATVNIFIRDPLKVRQSDTTICLGQSVNVSPWLSGGDSSYMLIWDNGADSSFSRLFTPDSSISFRLDLYDGCTPLKDSTIFRIYVRPQLDISIRPDTMICKGNSVLLAPIAAGGDSTYTISWNNGLGNGASKTVNPDTSTTYLAILSDACSTKNDSASVRILVRDSLAISLRSDSTICIGNSVYLEPMLSGGDSTYTVSWNNSLADGFSHTVSPQTTTTYQAIIRDGCTVKDDTATVTIFVRLPLTISFPPDDTICIGNSIKLHPLKLGGDSSYTVSWNFGLDDADSVIVSPIVNTTYRAILSDACTVKNDTAFYNVFVRDSLKVKAVFDTTICFGQSVEINAIPQGGRANTWQYDWDNGLGNGSTKIVAPTDTTTYTVIFSDGCTNRQDTAKVTVRVRPYPQVYAGRDTLICESKSVTLTATGKYGKPGSYVFTWNNGLGIGPVKVVNPGSSTTYIVELSDSCSPKVYDTVVVSVENKPSLQFYVSDSFICLGERVSFDNLSSGGVAYTYTWRFGTGADSSVFEPNYTYPKIGFFNVTLIARSALGCVDSLVKMGYMQVNPNPIADFAANPPKGNFEYPGVQFIQKSILATHYEWDFGDGSNPDHTDQPKHKYQDTGWYTVTLIAATDEGCFDTISKPYRIEEIYRFYIPTAFSPNGDGDNEVFKYDGRGYIKVRVIIFNRWGEKVFETDKRNEYWNGGMNNSEELLPQGVYVYTIQVIDFKNQFHTYSGDVTLLR